MHRKIYSLLFLAVLVLAIPPVCPSGACFAINVLNIIKRFLSGVPLFSFKGTKERQLWRAMTVDVSKDHGTKEREREDIDNVLYSSETNF